ncbi:MAG: diadenylate cyclase CdaA [Lachnospiraceae bacterium]|nr:diadenylate cyclase CdaA [Lachnospiraceae bacterium]
MNNILNSIDVFLDDYLDLNVPNIHVVDIVEIIIIAFFLYHILRWFYRTRAWSLFRGLMVVVLFFIVAAFLQMNTILWLGEKILSFAVIMIVVVFQPELRKALEDLGNRRFFGFFAAFGARGIAKRFEDKTLNDMVIASFEMGAVKTGALIVVANNDNLDAYERTGIKLDSLLSRQLLVNIFEKNTPLHDGAVIVNGDRIVSATCYLPLSENMNLSKDLGTRHRAAIGISEATDALIIVVSEETGQVSVAMNGNLVRNVDDSQLVEMLREIQRPVEAEDEQEEGKEDKHESTDEA